MLTLMVGAAGVGAEAAGVVGPGSVTGGGVVSAGAGGAVLVTTGADASAWASPLIVPELGVAADRRLAGGATSE